MKRLLVLGGNGLIGHQLVRHFHANATSRIKSRGTIYLDITDTDRLREVIISHRPDYILNATGLGFEQCRVDPHLASLVNTRSVAILTELANEIGAQVVQLSTDYVFDGARGEYTEEDMVSPLSVYGRTKLEGESYVLQSGGIVIRLGLVYELSYSGRKITLPEAVRRHLINKNHFGVAMDQRLSPTLLRDVPYLIQKLLEHRVRGLFHAGSPRSITRFEFCRLAAQAYGLNPNLVLPIRMADDRFYDGRPIDTSLVVRKAMNFWSLTDVWDYLGNSAYWIYRPPKVSGNDR